MDVRDRPIVEIYRREFDPDERASCLVANDPVRALPLSDDFEGRGAGELLTVTDEILDLPPFRLVLGRPFDRHHTRLDFLGFSGGLQRHSE